MESQVEISLESATSIPISNKDEPLVEVQIFDRKFFGVLDTGSSHSTIGQGVFETLEKFDVLCNHKRVTFTFPNSSFQATYGQTKHPVQQIINIPIQFDGFMKIQEFICVSSQSLRDVILGRDFIVEAGIQIDILGNHWKFLDVSPIPRANPAIEHQFLKLPLQCPRQGQKSVSEESDTLQHNQIISEEDRSIKMLVNIYDMVKRRECWNCDACNSSLYHQISQGEGGLEN